MYNSALVLLSGGQDSTTCLALAKQNHKEVHSISFDYGQKHSIELRKAEYIAIELANVKNHVVVPIDIFDFFKEMSSLTDITQDVNKKHYIDKSLPSSFVPGRNYILLGVAAMYAYKKRINYIYTGVCATDECITGDSLIDCPRNLNKYPEGIPIKELVGKEFLTWSWDIKNQKTVLKKAFNVRKTSDLEKVYKITYTWGTGKNKKFNHIKATENHKFLLTSGEYIKVKDLNIKDSLQPFNISWDNEYRMITDSSFSKNYEHKMIMSFIFNKKMNKTWVPHHKDFDPKNNEINNLEILSVSKHRAIHSKYNWKNNLERYKNNNYFINNNPMNHKKYRRKVSNKKKEWWDNLSEEEKQLISKNARQKTLKQMQSPTYINPSKLPGVKLKQKYSAYKRYRNIEGMEKIKKEAEEQGINLNHKIISIEYIGEESVYDMEVEDTHNFAANGIFIHNSGYPDCREESINAIERSLTRCLDYPIKIETPLIDKTKAETVQWMQRLGKLDWYRYTHTCYNGKNPPCLTCPSCVQRIKGFKEAEIKDPLLEG